MRFSKLTCCPFYGGKNGKKEYFYSNCLIEAAKAKLKNWHNVKITYIPPKYNECCCPHFMWSDGQNDYDFGTERYLNWYERVWFKGEIRKHSLGWNKKWKAHRIMNYQKKRCAIKMTNYEKIKNMSVEEMAELLCNAKNGICPKICNNEGCGYYIIDSYCREGIKQWLNSEVGDEF